MNDNTTIPTDGQFKKSELQRLLMVLLEYHELDVSQKVDKTNLATLNKVGLRGAIAECCGFEYYDNEPWDHWGAKTNSYHREGQEAFTTSELEQLRDELTRLEEIDE